MSASGGPLTGLSVLELGGVGPVPFCGMYFADLGAEVIRVERPLGTDPLSLSRQNLNLCARGKRSIALDLRSDEGRRIARQLVGRSDIVMEGFRPGVLERLGLGPSDCLTVNRSLIFGRMTGFGAAGPFSGRAAHDINYLALSGLLSTIGPKSQPMPPLNIVGDFGGALYLVAGLLAALTCARSTGQGQVVESTILGGTVALMSQLFTIRDHGEWKLERESNWMDGGAPFYRTYQTSDGRFMAVGAIEPQFYEELIRLLGLVGVIDPSEQMDRGSWQQTTEQFATAFRAKSFAEWSASAGLVDACCTPVLDLDEAREHPQTSTMFVEVGGMLEPSPQPRFTSTPVKHPDAAHPVGADAASVLRDLGHDDEAIEHFYDAGVVSRPF